MPSTIKSLADIIVAAVDRIDQSCAARQVPFPELDDVFTPPSEAARMSPDVLESSALLISAAVQLIATVRAPPVTLAQTALSYTLGASLGTVNELNIGEILGRAGPQGMHVVDIGAKTNTDPAKIARLLRCLATNHIFTELSPDVFAHNRISSLLDTGKTYEEVSKNPLEKYDGTPGFSALVGHCTDEQTKAAIAMKDNLSDPKTAFSQEPFETNFNRAFNATGDVWKWFEEPQNEMRRRRFGIAMTAVSVLQPPDSITKGFDWGSLPKGSLIVDVGGGLGSVAMIIAKAHPQLRLIVEDRESTIAEADKFWKSNFPEGLNGDRTKLIAHDFFSPQPATVVDPAIFILRTIAHDWADTYLVRILKHLRAAAVTNTRLIVIDTVIAYACEDPETEQVIKGAKTVLPPKPLLANMGGARALDYAVDIQVLNAMNSVERTLRQHSQVLLEGGWKLVEVIKTHELGMWHPQLIAIPI